MLDAQLRLPRMDDRFHQENRRIHAGTKSEALHLSGTFDILCRFDLKTGETREYQFHDEIFGEAIFAASSPAAPEGQGYIMALTNGSTTQVSSCVIFEAHAIEQGPIARIRLPHHVPHGLHGNWISHSP